MLRSYGALVREAKIATSPRCQNRFEDRRLRSLINGALIQLISIVSRINEGFGSPASRNEERNPPKFDELGILAFSPRMLWYIHRRAHIVGAALPGEAASRFWRRLADDMG